ncbi:MAG: hypothetical protein IPM54_09400 [Polyangiaceae bacterium]|nr:hypothetical protein [Polyangiaceae bacterium]
MNISTSILRSTSSVMFFAVSLYGMGCMVEPGDMGPGSEEEYISQVELGAGGDPGTQNHLEDLVLMNHGVQETVRALGDAALVNSSNQLPSMPYMPAHNATGDLEGARVDFLEVLIGCALSSSQTVTDPAHTIGYFLGIPVKKSYTGEIGIAPAWTWRALTTTEKRYVTACVMQRVNAYGEVINILLQTANGSYQPLNRSTEDLELYPVAESVAWGNMFDSTIELSTTNSEVPEDTIPFVGHICREYSSAQAPWSGLRRQCDNFESCGFTYEGNCSELSCAFGTPCWYSVRARLKDEDWGNFYDLYMP